MHYSPIKYFVLTLLILVSGSCFADDHQQPADPDMQNIAETYFTALSSGDLDVLLSLLAEDALVRSEDQLRDPAYSGFLANRYSSARLEVVASGNRGELRYVDLIIWLSDTESIKERLILRAIDSPQGVSYHIVSREDFDI